MTLLSIDFTNLHTVLESLYEEMMPLCGDMLAVSKGLAGLGALFYVAVRVWQSLARAEPIDVYPLLRPFAVGICILNRRLCIRKGIFPCVSAVSRPCLFLLVRDDRMQRTVGILGPCAVRIVDYEVLGLDRSLLFSSPALYDLVWKPLEEELSGMKNVYFSPAGELHRTAIEYAPVSEDTIFSDRYNAFRLSSTRQLAVTGDNGNDVDGEGAVLYGGLRYNARPSVIAADSRKYAASDDGTRSAPVMPELAADSLIARGTRIAELPATKVEVDSIGTMMRGRSVDVSLFTDTIGTEASFKALSGQRRGIIHIATHGFFGKNDPADNALATPDAGRTTRHMEDKAMTRSGLLFAGAANAWQMPDTVDNGILTAQEVSALDLRGLDLCVLSACETGLGEITGEGVFGLQRGFKKAGAGTLMVSLRPVYDKATGLLMTEFYRNLLAGKSKTASLKAAQQYLRSYEEPATEDAAQTQGGAGRAGKFAKARQQSAAATTNAPTATVKPYADPVSWAYFILVDAL